MWRPEDEPKIKNKRSKKRVLLSPPAPMTPRTKKEKEAEGEGGENEDGEDGAPEEAEDEPDEPEEPEEAVEKILYYDFIPYNSKDPILRALMIKDDEEDDSINH